MRTKVQNVQITLKEKGIDKLLDSSRKENPFPTTNNTTQNGTETVD